MTKQRNPRIQRTSKKIIVQMQKSLAGRGDIPNTVLVLYKMYEQKQSQLAITRRASSWGWEGKRRVQQKPSRCCCCFCYYLGVFFHGVRVLVLKVQLRGKDERRRKISKTKPENERRSLLQTVITPSADAAAIAKKRRDEIVLSFFCIHDFNQWVLIPGQDSMEEVYKGVYVVYIS